jgi:hypothetical protein
VIIFRLELKYDQVAAGFFPGTGPWDNDATETLSIINRTSVHEVCFD